MRSVQIALNEESMKSVQIAWNEKSMTSVQIAWKEQSIKSVQIAWNEQSMKSVQIAQISYFAQSYRLYTFIYLFGKWIDIMFTNDTFWCLISVNLCRLIRTINAEKWKFHNYWAFN